MITTRYVDVAFNGGRSAMARALYQYDYGQILRITDLELPVAYEVHFALNKSGNSVTQIGNADGVNIPDAMLLQNGSFYAWFYLHQTGDDGETRYEILFPVMQRAKPTNATPTPVQQDAITEAIAALNSAVEQTGEDVEAAAASASSAADSESNAEAWAVGERDGTPVDPSDPTYHNNSAYYAGVAESASQGGEGFALKSEGFAVGEQNGTPVESGSPYYHNNAEYYKNQSSGYSSNASAKATAAAGSALESEGWARGTQDGSEVSSGSPYYHHNAAYYATDAGASAYNAGISETNAESAKRDAVDAKTAAQTAQGLAEAAKTAADADALKAEGYAVGTQNGTPVTSGSPYYHNNASYYAGEASGYASDASGYASAANDAKIAAQGAQTAAETAQGLAEAAQRGAESAQTAAETARDAAIAATEDKAPVILDSASGAIVSIVDGAGGMKARSIVSAFSPIQSGSGDPSPNNIRPISGRTGLTAYRTGVNVWDEEWEEGYYSSTGEPSGGSGYIRSKNYISVKPNASYYCKTGTESNFCLQFYNADKAFLLQDFTLRDSLITIPSDCYYLRFWRNENAYANNISINYPATDTDYHAYTGASFPVSWQTEAGTVYGGTVDVVTGVLTVEYAMVDLGTLAFALWNSNANRDCYSHTFSDILNVSSASENIDAISSVFKATNYNATWTPWQMSFTNTQYQVVFTTPHEEYATPDDFATAMDGVQFLYKLATPQTYQLTPTQVQMLLGVNNVWATGDSVSLTYPCDTRLYIERLTEPTEDDMVANANIPIHKFFMIGNGLYYSTAAIAQGAAIVVGTNCNSVSLADALNQLA